MGVKFIVRNEPPTRSVYLDGRYIGWFYGESIDEWVVEHIRKLKLKALELGAKDVEIKGDNSEVVEGLMGLIDTLTGDKKLYLGA